MQRSEGCRSGQRKTGCSEADHEQPDEAEQRTVLGAAPRSPAEPDVLGRVGQGFERPAACGEGEPSAVSELDSEQQSVPDAVCSAPRKPALPRRCRPQRSAWWIRRRCPDMPFAPQRKIAAGVGFFHGRPVRNGVCVLSRAHIERLPQARRCAEVTCTCTSLEPFLRCVSSRALPKATGLGPITLSCVNQPRELCCLGRPTRHAAGALEGRVLACGRGVSQYHAVHPDFRG